MKPLQSIAMGMVVIVLLAPVGGFDLLADPLGWVLVLIGVHRLPDDLPHRSTLFGVAVLAAVVSLPLWVPDVVSALDDADDGLAWAVNLPQLGCYALLCHSLAQSARTHRAQVAETWWRSACFGVLLVIVLPVLVFGGGLDGLTDAAGLAVALVPLTIIVLLFVYAGRTWAGGPAAPPRTNLGAETQEPPAGSSGGGH